MNTSVTSLEELRKQHRALDARIKKCEKRPGCCPTEVRRMKKDKLRLKEIITLLEKERGMNVLDLPGN